MIIMDFENLSVAYEDVVLSDVTFSVEKGDFICIVGENGSGKTTLCKVILGLLSPQNGKVIKKEDLRIGYVPQKLSIKQDFPASAEEIVRTGVRTSRPFLTRTEKKLVLDNMRLLGIEALRKKSFRALSGGQQQRVLIARALTASDGILILDEPTGGLDPVAVSDLYALLKDLNRRDGTTILMVTHDISASLSAATKILHIDKTVKYFGAPAGFICSECGKRLLGGEANA